MQRLLGFGAASRRKLGLRPTSAQRRQIREILVQYGERTLAIKDGPVPGHDMLGTRHETAQALERGAARWAAAR
jgi:hypothetical protein